MTGRLPGDQLGFDLAVAPPPALPPPSDEQRSVLEFAADLVVVAGAGSGKTRTLVDLYARLIEESGIAGPSRILCLTFTDRAAREIQRRIQSRIAAPAHLREIESAPVTTFHAWCTRVLKEHPIEVGIDPRFRVLQAEEADELLRRCASDILRQGLAAGDRAAQVAVGILGLGRATARLAELVQSIRNAGWSERRPIERFEERLAEVEALAAGPLVQAVGQRGRSFAEEARRTRLTPRGATNLAAFEAALEAWNRAPGEETAEALAAGIRAVGRTPQFDGARELREEIAASLAAWRMALDETGHRLQLGAWPALTVSLRAGYREARRALGALDYDDLLLRTRDLFAAHSEILALYRQRYQAVLVDEHQDTDPVQHEILRLLIGDDALAGRPRPEDPRWCVVGDPRQAIYGFRGATMAAFTDLAARAAARDAHRTLAFNYRSRRALVDFHNAFFPDLLPDGHVPQRAYRPAEGEGVAVELLASGDLGLSVAEAQHVEARALAARLRAACDEDDPGRVLVPDGAGEMRTARAGDIVLLLRRLTQVEPYRRALQTVGLDPILAGGGGFYGRQEVFDVLNALEAALFPHDPVALVSFLRSPMVGLADDALYVLSRGWKRNGTSLVDHIAGTLGDAGVESEERRRTGDGVAILEGIRQRADREPPGQVLTWLIDRTGYAAVLDALPDSHQRRANLARLLSMADEAPALEAALLTDWTARLRQRTERPPREVDASLPESEGRVRILTIHAAKGLEFPIVAVADIGGTLGSGPGDVAFDRHLGVVAKWWESPATQGRPTLSYHQARLAEKAREQAEETRILYVAATRARERLFLSGPAGTGPWLSHVRAFTARPDADGVLTTSSLVDWAGRFPATSRSRPPAMAETGVACLPPVPPGAGEIPASRLAAAWAGQPANTGRPGRPAAVQEVEREARRLGVVGHAALERFPLQRPVGFDLAGWLTAAIGMTPEDGHRLAGFIERDVAPELDRARRYFREHPFRLHLPDDGGIVVGTIDCLLEDAGGTWWVWDYKFGTGSPDLDATHAAQLSIYALAAAAAFGLAEIRGRLWHVADGTTRDFVWDGTALVQIEAELPRFMAAI